MECGDYYFKKFFTKISLKIFHFAVLGLILISIPSWAHGDEEDYDDVSISFTVPNVGTTEVQALVKGETVYLSVKEIFDLLKIKMI